MNAQTEEFLKTAGELSLVVGFDKKRARLEKKANLLRTEKVDLLGAPRISHRLDVSLSQAYQLMASGVLGKTVRIGRSVRLPSHCLEEYLARLEEEI